MVLKEQMLVVWTGLRRTNAEFFAATLELKNGVNGGGFCDYLATSFSIFWGWMLGLFLLILELIFGRIWRCI